MNQIQKTALTNTLHAVNAKLAHCDDMIKALREMKKNAAKNDAAIIHSFKNRLNLTQEECTLLDNMEKFLSQATNTSQNGEVLLNHLAVAPDKRIPVQFKLNKNGRPSVTDDKQLQFTLQKTDVQALNRLVDFLNKHSIKATVAANHTSFSIPDKQFVQLYRVMGENNVKTALGLNIQPRQTTPKDAPPQPALRVMSSLRGASASKPSEKPAADEPQTAKRPRRPS